MNANQGCTRDGQPILLLDMDNVFADFETGFLSNWRESHPDAPWVPVTERTTFYVSEQLGPDYKERAGLIATRPGFFAGLDPIPGAIDAIQSMTASGLHVVIVTAPPRLPAPHAAGEKIDWVTRHLGEQYRTRVIVTNDKTLVHGRWLIDDAPSVTGAATPVWEHIVYTQPYNVTVTDKRRINHLSDWRSLLLND